MINLGQLVNSSWRSSPSTLEKVTFLVALRENSAGGMVASNCCRTWPLTELFLPLTCVGLANSFLIYGCSCAFSTTARNWRCRNWKLSTGLTGANQFSPGSDTDDIRGEDPAGFCILTFHICGRRHGQEPDHQCVLNLLTAPVHSSKLHCSFLSPELFFSSGQQSLMCKSQPLLPPVLLSCGQTKK